MTPADSTITVIATKKNLDLLRMATSGDPDDLQRLRQGGHIQDCSPMGLAPCTRTYDGLGAETAPSIWIRCSTRLLLTDDGWKLWTQNLIFDVSAVYIKKTRAIFTIERIRKTVPCPSHTSGLTP